MKKVAFILALSAFVLLSTTPASLWAQSRPQLSSAARNTFRSATNAIVTLTTDDSLSAGSYAFKNSDAPDADADLVKFNGEFKLGEESDQIIPLFQISPAYVELEQSSDVDDLKLKVESMGIGAGGGVLMKFFENVLEVTPRMKIEYSSIKYSSSSSSLDVTELNAELPDLDAWSYIPSLEFALKPEISESGNSKLLVDSQISFVYIHASTSSSSADDFSDKSWVWKNSLGVETPLIDSKNSSLFIRPQISRIDMHGAARNGFDFNNFYEIGLDLFTYDFMKNYFQTLGFGATYVYEKEIQGWRLGFFADFS